MVPLFIFGVSEWERKEKLLTSRKQFLPIWESYILELVVEALSYEIRHIIYLIPGFKCCLNLKTI